MKLLSSVEMISTSILCYWVEAKADTMSFCGTKIRVLIQLEVDHDSSTSTSQIKVQLAIDWTSAVSKRMQMNAYSSLLVQEPAGKDMYCGSRWYFQVSRVEIHERKRQSQLQQCSGNSWSATVHRQSSAAMFSTPNLVSSRKNRVCMDRGTSNVFCSIMWALFQNNKHSAVSFSIYSLMKSH